MFSSYKLAVGNPKFIYKGNLYPKNTSVWGLNDYYITYEFDMCNNLGNPTRSHPGSLIDRNDRNSISKQRISKSETTVK